MIINTNVSSLVSQSFLNKANKNLNGVMQQLSSGKRINGAADDAAGLAISTRMTSQISGMEVATRNANDGISMLQTAEGALGSIGNILQRMRDLAVQADNGTYSDSDKVALQSEFKQLSDEIDSIADKTEFNGVKLLDGTNSTVSLHVGQGSGDVMALTFASAKVGTLGVKAGAGAGELDLTTDAKAAITAIDAALDTVSSNRADLGSYMNRLDFTIDNLNTNGTNLAAARSRIQDADMAKASSELTKQRVLTQSGIAMLAQANQSPQMVLQLLG